MNHILNGKIEYIITVYQRNTEANERFVSYFSGWDIVGITNFADMIEKARGRKLHRV